MEVIPPDYSRGTRHTENWLSSNLKSINSFSLLLSSQPKAELIIATRAVLNLISAVESSGQG